VDEGEVEVLKQGDDCKRGEGEWASSVSNERAREGRERERTLLRPLDLALRNEPSAHPNCRPLLAFDRRRSSSVVSEDSLAKLTDGKEVLREEGRLVGQQEKKREAKRREKGKDQEERGRT
jgi:hypothetical protein